MLLFLASRHDRNARLTAERWASFGAEMITCRDLSVAGWRLSVSSPSTSTAVVNGRVVSCKEITGILTRLPWVFPSEIVHIQREDRAYVAAEMGAFLVAWLSAMSCPILNRPTASCLSGPNWRPEQWAYAASCAGIPIRTRERRVERTAVANPTDLTDDVVRVTVVGQECIGQVDPRLADWAKRVARVSGVDLVEVLFSGGETDPYFEGADTWPDLSRVDIADAVLRFLRTG